MNAISCDKKLRKTFSMPYHIGVYLALNAVSDACLIVDGPNCSVPKAEFIYGNHDLFSTIFSPDGAHRLLYTMARPLKQTGNPDERLSVLLRAAADSGKFGIVLLTALPFLKLAGTDYEGLASETSCKTPVIEIAPKSLESGWLGGYSQALDSMVRAMPYSIAPEYQTHVPLVFWASEGMIRHDHLDKECIKKEAEQGHFSHDYIFHTLVGLTETDSKLYDKKLDLFDNCRKEPLPE